MSNIFDALLKSESDRGNGNNSSALQMLQRAEREAASQRKAELAGQRAAVAQRAAIEAAPSHIEFDPLSSITPDMDAEGQFAAAAAVTAAPQMRSSVSPAILEVEDKQSLFNSFRTIRVSLPAFSRLVAVTDKSCPAAEAFRLLCVRLRHFRKDRLLRNLMITSTVPQEGKSFSAANLACTIAAVTQQKVLLIDGDLRRPAQPPIFGLDNMPGMCEWLQGTQKLQSTIYYLDGPNVWFISAGVNRANPLELLQSSRLATLIQEVSGLFDWVIIDSPPVLPLADTSVLARLADGIILVTRRGVTEKRQLKRGVEAIEKGKLLGAIINSSLRYHNKDYYYYSSSESKPRFE